VANPSIWVNGQEQGSLVLPDRGLEFGDGLFETLLCHQGNPLFIEDHLARLSRGFSILGFSLPLEIIHSRIMQACEGCEAFDWAVVRATVTRGAAERGYAPPADPEPNVVVRASAIDRDCAVFSSADGVIVEGVQLTSQTVFAGIKHLNRLEQVLAAQEVSQAGCEEGVMLNQANEPVSVVAGNLFVVKDGVVSTPPVKDCPVIGTRRTKVLDDWAPRIGARVEERPLSRSDVESADEVFYSNALHGVRGVSTLGDLSWSEWPLTERIFSAYLDDLP
jgi:4-amino-4-deoxychorismate lyase